MFGWKRRREALATLRRAEAELVPGSLVLDIGCGMGYVLDVLSQDYGAIAIGCDVVAPRRGVESRFIRFDGWNLPFADGSVDLSLLVFVLHHAKNPNQLLREAMRVTRGALLVVEDTPANPFDYHWGRLHIRRFNRRHNIPWLGENRDEMEWRTLFEENDLRIVKTSRLSRFERMPPVARTAFLLKPKRVSRSAAA